MAIACFEDQLRRYAPPAQPIRPSLTYACQYTIQLTAGHYENFPVLSWAIPKPQRQHVANVYAFCRWSDDIGDEVGDPDRSLALFDWWESELDACFAGQAAHPVLVALEETVQRFAIPKQPFADLIVAFRRDQRQTQYKTFDDLVSYCRCSADPVGRIVLYLCESFDAERARLSDQICTGLQLANFCQDVGNDVDRGRIYLPLDDCQQFGVPEADILSKHHTPAFAALVRHQVERARGLLEAGLPLSKQLSGRWRQAISLFARGGLAILQKIEACNYQVLTQRPKLTKLDFAKLMATSLW